MKTFKTEDPDILEARLKLKYQNINDVVSRKMRMNRNKILRKTINFIAIPFRS